MAPEEQPNSCIEAGFCLAHGEQLERRRNDRRDIDALQESLTKFSDRVDTLISTIHTRIDSELPNMKIKVFAISLSMSLIIVMLLGAYSYVAMSNADQRANLTAAVSNHQKLLSEFRSDLQEHLVKIDNNHNKDVALITSNLTSYKDSSKNERTALADQVVRLMTASAEQKEWQRGVMRQLEMLNVNFSKILDKDKANSTRPSYYDGPTNLE